MVRNRQGRKILDCKFCVKRQACGRAMALGAGAWDLAAVSAGLLWLENG